MSDLVLAAIIGASGGSVVGPLLMRLLNRRQAAVQLEASVAEQWQRWSEAQGKRITALEGRVGTLEQALEAERTENAGLRAQVDVQARLLRSVCRWALTLRDELLRMGGGVPPTPADVEAALTSLEP